MTSRKSPKRTKDKSLAPINVSRELWLYAERKGLCVVRHKSSVGAPDVFYLPWAKVRRALDTVTWSAPNKRKAKR